MPEINEANDSIIALPHRQKYLGRDIAIAISPLQPVLKINPFPVCRAYGEGCVLVVCDKDNEASRRTIIKNGGKLENEVTEDIGSGERGIIQRYWIDLASIDEGEWR